jgi:hypothetical protein
MFILKQFTMKYFFFVLIINAITFGACQKNENIQPNQDPWDGKNLVGNWTPVKLTIILKYDDGSTQTVNPPIESGDFIEFTYLKTELRNAEGGYTSQGLGVFSEGTWDLENWNGRLSFRTVGTDGNAIFLYRKVQTLDAHTLVLTADDEMVKEWANINGLNNNEYKKITGGSVYEQYSK